MDRSFSSVNGSADKMADNDTKRSNCIFMIYLNYLLMTAVTLPSSTVSDFNLWVHSGA